MASEKGRRILENRDIRTKSAQFGTLAEWQDGKVEDIPVIRTADEILEAHLAGEEIGLYDLARSIRESEDRDLADRVVDSLDTESMPAGDCLHILRMCRGTGKSIGFSRLKDRVVANLVLHPLYAEDMPLFCGKGGMLEGYASRMLPHLELYDIEEDCRTVMDALTGTPDEQYAREWIRKIKEEDKEE